MQKGKKHLTLAERGVIEHMLKGGASLRSIGRAVGKHPTTISKEIKGHIQFRQSGGWGSGFNNCKHRFGCDLTNVCGNPDCRKKPGKCSRCKMRCVNHCEYFEREDCPRLAAPPYVCNGCSDRRKCTLEKRLYEASAAHDEYKDLLSGERSGTRISPEEMDDADSIVSPLLKKGQSLHVIWSNHADELGMSEATLYRRLHDGSFSASVMDSPAIVQRKPYRPTKQNRTYKVDRRCLEGRRYEDYTALLAERGLFPTVQMDTVIGRVGGKPLLTIHFREAHFMLAFLLEKHNAKCVGNVFDKLYEDLTPEVFRKLFPVILTDNGSGFSDPAHIETDSHGARRTSVYYCHPQASFEKGSIENNHTLLRRILPKGTSFDDLTQADVNVIMSHVNSYLREEAGDCVPIDLFKGLHPHGQTLLDVVGISKIPADNVTLKPALLDQIRG